MKHIIALASLVPLVPLVPLVLSSCDAPADEDEEQGETPAAEACEHARDGPANAVDASTVGDTTAGDVSAAHTRHDVTLVPVEGGNGGFVRFDSAGGRTLIFATVDLPLAATSANGAAIALRAAEESECVEVVKSFSGEMPIGIVFLELGPSDDAVVSLVVEAESAAADEE